MEIAALKAWQSGHFLFPVGPSRPALKIWVGRLGAMVVPCPVAWLLYMSGRAVQAVSIKVAMLCPPPAGIQAFIRID
jgi:hypothetical protein